MREGFDERIDSPLSLSLSLYRLSEIKFDIEEPKRRISSEGGDVFSQKDRGKRKKEIGKLSKFRAWSIPNDDQQRRCEKKPTTRENPREKQFRLGKLGSTHFSHLHQSWYIISGERVGSTRTLNIFEATKRASIIQRRKACSGTESKHDGSKAHGKAKADVRSYPLGSHAEMAWATYHGPPSNHPRPTPYLWIYFFSFFFVQFHPR